MKIGILIGRLNPPHIGHMRILNESLKKNDKTILLIGSSNIINDSNPFTFDDRKRFINILYKNNSFFIDKIDDYPSDEDWCIELNKILEQEISREDEIVFYGGDFENDYAIKIIRDYLSLIKFQNIQFIEIPRKNIKINHNDYDVEISSTKVREVLKNGDKKLLEKLVDGRIIPDIL